MKRKIAALLLSAGVLGSTFPAAEAVGEETAKLKIMPLGDSITDGYWEQGGYRKYLSVTLSDMGIDNIDLVGPKGGDAEKFTYNGAEVEYDGNYAGYSGYAIQYMDGKETRQGILETLKDGDLIKKYSPDIVLLQIGTNDVLSAYNDGITDRLENLVNYILDEGGSGETVFVSTIPDIDSVLVSDWLWAYGEEKWNSTPEEFAVKVQGYVDSYNESVSELVKKMQGEGKRVMFGDIHSVVDMKTDLYDGVHPNEAGYEKMGKYWADTVAAYIGGGEPGTEASEPSSDALSEPETEAETETETVIVEKRKKTYRHSDMWILGNYLLNRNMDEVPEITLDDYDLTNDGRIDGFDLAALRKEIDG